MTSARRAKRIQLSQQTANSTPAAAPKAAAGSGMEMFTFGDPEPVLDRAQMIEYIEAAWNGRWYEPPISVDGLARSLRANAHHGSAIFYKRNQLLKLFKPHPLLDAETFGRWVLDTEVFGNGYVERRTSRTGRVLTLKHALAKYMRRGKEASMWFVPNGWDLPYEFEPGSVFQLMQPDIHQEVYGLPEYLGSMQSVWLNESATLFRRRFYNNGSHAGFILYVSDPSANTEDVDAMRTALKNSKGPGNFRNLFFYSPNGKKDGITLIPISEVAAKDEFFDIKNVSRDDVLAAHRIPPQLLGIIPNNAGGFGSVREAADVYHHNEIEPMQRRYELINDWVGEEVVQWREYSAAPATPVPAMKP